MKVIGINITIKNKLMYALVKMSKNKHLACRELNVLHDAWIMWKS